MSDFPNIKTQTVADVQQQILLLLYDNESNLYPAQMTEPALRRALGVKNSLWTILERLQGFGDEEEKALIVKVLGSPFKTYSPDWFVTADYARRHPEILRWSADAAMEGLDAIRPAEKPQKKKPVAMHLTDCYSNEAEKQLKRKKEKEKKKSENGELFV